MKKIKVNKVVKPYQHDCPNCKWVGWFTPWADKPPYNVYLCGETVVIRYSDEPSDYWSSTAGGTKGSLSIDAMPKG